ncbi:C-C motif chemokine 5-like [Rhea pennata]|uniref:C-C motif chemokine 5-like n=1 Tax=Rhea pennata TaxID=8795 RepID=UPI002E2539E3
MKSFTAALAVLFVAAFCYQVSSSPAAVNIFGPCCSRYLTKAIPEHRVKAYAHTSNHCIQPAVIFTTVKDKMLCGNPEDKWVQDIMNHLKDKAGSGRTAL